MRVCGWHSAAKLYRFLAAAVLLLGGCAGNPRPAAPQISLASAPESPRAVAVAPEPEAAPREAVNRIIYRETGIASWYGKEFQGKKTASGETFDMHKISAAHRTLPLGTIIRVTNLDNFKSINVRVNDRGPFTGNRVLEVSYAAARALGFVAEGTAPVKIETVEPFRETGPYTVQAAVFAEEENAQQLKDRLSLRFEVITIVPFETNLGEFYRVRVGSYGTEEKAELVASRLKKEGLEPYVVKKD